MKLIEEIELVPEEETRMPNHKGLFYRVRHSSYYSQSSGTFHKKMEIKPLKRISCKGCPTCEYINEMIEEVGVDDLFDQDFKHGQKLELFVESSIWDSPYGGREYDSWIEWRIISD